MDGSGTTGERATTTTRRDVVAVVACAGVVACLGAASVKPVMWNFALMLMNLGSACGDLPVSQECLRQLQRLRNDAGVPDPSMSAWHMAILAALGVSTALIVLRKEAFGGLAMFAAAVGTGASFVLASDSYLHQFSETLGSPWATPPPPWMALPLALPAIGLYIVAAVLARRTMQQRAPFAVDAS